MQIQRLVKEQKGRDAGYTRLDKNKLN